MGYVNDNDETREWREFMVRMQLAGRGIRDRRVLEAMGSVPRHLFCPPGTAPQEAYADHPLPVGSGQTISQPWMVADMLQALELKGNETVLEIGTGSGYGAAVLAKLVTQVHTVELLPELAESAGKRLRELGYGNITVHLGDGSAGWPEAVPYDAIVVTAGAPEVPEPLKQQLRDGGRLVVPVGDRFTQELLVVHRAGSRFHIEPRGGCRFVPLVGAHGWQT